MTSGHFERRLFERRPLATTVTFEDEFGEGLFFVSSLDVSEGGISLASDVPLRLGSLLFLSFQLPGHKRSVRVTGEVVRNPATASTKGSMGIRFVGLSDLTLKRLQEFLSAAP